MRTPYIIVEDNESLLKNGYCANDPSKSSTEKK